MSELPVKIIDCLDSSRGEVALRGLRGSYLAYLLSEAVKEEKGPFLVLTPTASEAETILGDLNFYLGKGRLISYPSWEILPYENLSPLPDIVGERMAALYALLTGEVDVVVAPVTSVMQRTVPRSFLRALVDYVAAGEELPFGPFLDGLVERGYRRASQVEEKGEFSVRGGIVDLWGPSMNLPVRMEFFGDEVDSIREFDPATQRSTGVRFDDLVILPAGEICLSPERADRVARRIRARGREMGIASSRLDDLLQGVSDGVPFPGIEFFIPDFYGETSTFFDFLPGDLTVIRVDPEETWERSLDFEETCRNRHAKALAGGWPFPAPEEIYLTAAEVSAALRERRTVLAGGVGIGAEKVIGFSIADNSDLRAFLRETGSGASPLARLAKEIKEWVGDGRKVIFAAHTPGHAERLGELLRPHGIVAAIHDGPPAFGETSEAVPIYIGGLSRGFRDEERGLVVITEEEIFGERHRRRGKLRKIPDFQATSFGQLRRDDYIVHVDHGIGIYRGLRKLEAGGTVGDYLELEYLGGDKVFVPVDRLNLVQRYSGSEKERPRLDALGSGSWEKVKKRVRKAVTELAKELMEIHAAREVMEGFSCSPGGEEYREFEAAFEYEETPDQKAAIDDVLRDLESRKPMDRLVCGDVGYGKTEVAIRASFKVVMEGRQVAVLVPTTILAQQHFETFSDRFKGYPVVIERLTRFCGRAKQREVLQRLKDGKIDIVIGTHRLLQKDVEFRSLGLVVIDEEQRFGVAHKERLKKIRKTVDVLTLTATPIPRTLNMALSGIKDLSIISSPPEGRQAIRTAVVKFDEEVIRESVLRELRRGGQVFFVHNRVQDIENVAARINCIVPEARIAVGHGQMGERQLEKVMLDFYEGKSNLLVCTTIIESGLDVPTANTIIINNAHSMGLAQLYQLRGRVGRSKHRAYAYLIVPGETILTREARKRLQAIQEMSELGAGFHLATYDLEIRGAGNIVGHEQSGNIEAVGFELFTSMLEKAVAELKGEALAEEIEPEIRFPLPAYIPEEYIADANQRLSLYKRLSSMSDEREVEEMRPELLDRFGPLPVEVKNFLDLISLKVLLKRAMVREASISERSITFVFHEKAPVDVERIVSMVGREPGKYFISPDLTFRMKSSSEDFREAVAEGKKILKALIGCGSF